MLVQPERLGEVATRLAKRADGVDALPSPAPVASASRFVVVQVRQALQHTAAIGAWSPTFVATWIIRPCQICFTDGL